MWDLTTIRKMNKRAAKLARQKKSLDGALPDRQPRKRGKR